MNNQRVIFVGIGVLLIILIASVFYLFRPKPAVAPSSQQSSAVLPTMIPQGSTQQNGQTKTTNPIVSAAPGLTPGDVVSKFYTWYLSYNGNVLATGAYKGNPYITSDFEQLMTSFAADLDPKFDPVFCQINKTKSFSLGNPIYTGTTKATVEITKLNTAVSLYHVVLARVNGQWKIDDVICVPPTQ